MPLLVSWSLAKVASDHGNAGLQALRCSMIIGRKANGTLISVEQAKRALAETGMRRTSVWKQWKNLVSAPFGVQLVTITDEAAPRCQARGWKKIVAELELSNCGTITLDAADLADFERFKLVIYAGLGYSQNRDGDGGTTISRQGIEKLTGASKWTQRRREKKLGIVKRENFAQVAIPRQDRKGDTARTLRQRYGRRVRQHLGDVVQIRNTYYAKGQAASLLHEPRTVAGEHASAGPLHPELGQRSYRQMFPDGAPTIEVARALVDAGVDVDVRLGEIARADTGEIVGLFTRLIGGAIYDACEFVDTLAQTIADRITFGIAMPN